MDRYWLLASDQGVTVFDPPALCRNGFSELIIIDIDPHPSAPPSPCLVSLSESWQAGLQANG